MADPDPENLIEISKIQQNIESLERELPDYLLDTLRIESSTENQKELVHSATEVAWASYRKILEDFGLNISLADGVKEKVRFWVYPVQGYLINECGYKEPFRTPEEIVGYLDRDQYDTIPKVLVALKERENSLLTDKLGRNLGSARTKRRIESIIEEWNYGLSGSLEIQPSSYDYKYYEKAYPRLLAHGFAKHWQQCEIDKAEGL